MAFDVKKYLDQSGVTTLWDKIKEADAALSARLDVIEGSGAGSIQKAVADEAAIARAAEQANATAIATLNGNGAGSVAQAVANGIASVVADADTDFDTLKEVADWIKSDTTGAAKMQSDIATLMGADTVEGSVAKAEKDAKAYAAGLDSAMDARVDALETAVGEGGSVAAQITAAIAGLDATKEQTVGADGLALSITEVDGKITGISGSIAANTYDAYGDAADAETSAKSYADTQDNALYTAIQSLSSADLSAILV